jgi:hypothetical protein
MATVFEEYPTEDKRSVVRFFCGQKDSLARKVIKKCLLFTVGSVSQLKRFHISRKYFANDEEVETEVRKWLRQKSKELLFCVFRRTGKAMGHVYQS